MQGKRILLIVGGGIAAYKSLELVRRLKERGASVRAILTKGGAEFVTPLSLSVLTEEKAFTDLFDLKDEAEIGHIRLSREADLIVVAPATADLLAKMAHGLADDLATAVLLATDKPVLAAPAMNVRMWQHPATQRNLATLKADGIVFVGPDEGEMACGEYRARPHGRAASDPGDHRSLLGESRSESARGTPCGRSAIAARPPRADHLGPDPGADRSGALYRQPLLRQAGPCARARRRRARRRGDADQRPGRAARSRKASRVVKVETAHEMLAATLAALPADIAICAAAVADWRAADESPHKLKKHNQVEAELKLALNPDILATIAKPGPKRPRLVIGFAAETENLIENATAKRRAKGADWIVANDVWPGTGAMGGDNTQVHLVTAAGVEDWPPLSKDETASRLLARAADALVRLRSAAE